jgi:hypothetical protein
MRKKYQIEIDRQLSQVAFLPYELKSEAPIRKIAFGSKTMEVDCKPHPKQKNLLVISKDIQESLLIPDFDVPLHFFVENGTLYIGPLVGVFTCGFTPFPFRPIGERSPVFAKLLSTAKTVGALPFVFGEQHIDWENGQINGFFYHQNKWIKKDIPFPNVIYDRLPNRLSEKRFMLKNIKERLQNDYLIPWYNPGFFNKLDIYEKLYQVDSVAKYLPETLPFQSFSLIEKMLSDYGHVYIKPKNSSLGQGIYQIIFDKEKNIYYCRFRDSKGENKSARFNSLEGLADRVFSKKKLSSMLVQQGIYLMKADNRPIDFRIHTNKDEHGNWHVTAIAAKAAGIGSVTTHLQNGGDIKTFEEIFPDINEQKRYTKKLTEVVLQMSIALEQQMQGFIGEIGFDVGIDRNGEVWVFEANSKPGRSIFIHPHLRKFENLSRRLSLAFAVFLTEQAITNPEELFK